MNNELQKLRNNLNITQVELSKLLNIPVKSIRNWENGVRIPSNYILELITNASLSLTNEKILLKNNEEQVLSFLTIKEKVKQVVSNYNIDRVYLYGSYAKGSANKESDIDLYMVSDIDGIDFFGVVEDLRNNLNNKVDLLSNKTVKENSEISKSIERTGILIYER
ncbi:MAG: helix-turn-helix domain-containing protein [Acholeplasmatales bacterium]|nr:helix-turn-helix domain-containing protein [Acholeplasmataceae bacterium]MDY0115408.1 helix-turn-helix domain-containing protein [Acholeplasmatales bacterium]MCK9289087.1 helix-turn-helix domain-containing protein [Acholeplasmataceae bacterium]MCK9427388.1 helix-turn-helix domain-containing protein [Acholeplasmataceae bacterium]MDD4090689.1 helix-turn-helix domain-containing protein [Acholeplasmataceae bacterium]